MILQAFIDDSQDSNPQAPHPRLLVYAGYVAVEDQWKAFDADWRGCLKDEPKIDYFRMTEAMNGRGQFEFIRKEIGEYKIRELYKIIKRYAAGATFSAVAVDDFNDVMASHPEVPEQLRNIHFFSYYGIVQNLAKGLPLLGLEGPVSFFFDSGNPDANDIFAAWNSFKNFGPIPLDVLSGSPDFEDDKVFVPLQAADYYAWIVRAKIGSQIRTGKPTLFPWEDGGGVPKVVHPKEIWGKKSLEAYIARVTSTKGS